MVREQIEARGVRDTRVVAAMRRVPRHLFVPEPVRADAYEDFIEGYRPREDGAQRLALPYDVDLKKQPAFNHLHRELRTARNRKALWKRPH